MREKEADNGEKIFKDFNNFINMKIKTLFKTIFCAGLVLTLVLYLCHLYGNYNLLAELKNRLKISIFLWRKSCASR